jgi:putative salt-induced outer membrane protein YdiY
MKKNVFLALTVVGFCAGAAAETEKPWDLAVELGAIATSGNTEATTIQARIEAKQNLTNWQNHYILSALFKEDQITLDDDTKAVEKTAEKYFGSIKSAYQLAREHSNLFVFGSHTEDKFGSYLKYSTIAIGYGARLFETDNITLDAEVGPGYFRGDKVVVDEITEKESGALLRGAANFNWQVTESAVFVQTLSVESAQDNTRTVAESSLATRINGSLQLKVGLNIANDSDVAPDKERTDTTSYINLVYKF